MTPSQVEVLRDAIETMQNTTDDRGYGRHAAVHGLPLPMECAVAHGQPSFLPWHRAYLVRFEQALRDTGHEVMLPWWDWTRSPEIPLAFAEPQRPDGRPNPLYSASLPPAVQAEGANSTEQATRQLSAAPQTVRQPGRSGSRLPTAAEIAATLEYTEYEQFNKNLDDFHGMVHGWVGGHMGFIPFASFDPIFWAHHCMVDRIWRIWQGRHPQASFPERLRGKTMTPFNLKAGEVLDPTTVGYDYAISIGQVRPSE